MKWMLLQLLFLGEPHYQGGKGRILGTLIGALIIGVLNNGLNIIGVSAFWQQVVKRSCNLNCCSD